MNAVPIAVTLTTAITNIAFSNPLPTIAANTTGALIGSSACILDIKSLEGKITQSLATNETKALLKLATRGLAVSELENENKKEELALQREQLKFLNHPELLKPSITHEENLLLIDNNNNENNSENGLDYFANDANNDPFLPINNLSSNNPQSNYATLKIPPAIAPRPKTYPKHFNVACAKRKSNYWLITNPKFTNNFNN